jgi:hypothetical protein
LWEFLQVNKEPQTVISDYRVPNLSQAISMIMTQANHLYCLNSIKNHLKLQFDGNKALPLLVDLIQEQDSAQVFWGSVEAVSQYTMSVQQL